MDANYMEDLVNEIFIVYGSEKKENSDVDHDLFLDKNK